MEEVIRLIEKGLSYARTAHLGPQDYNIAEVKDCLMAAYKVLNDLKVS